MQIAIHPSQSCDKELILFSHAKKQLSSKASALIHLVILAQSPLLPALAKSKLKVHFWGSQAMH